MFVKNKKTIIFAFVLIFFICTIKISIDLKNKMNQKMIQNKLIEENRIKINLEIAKTNKEIEETNIILLECLELAKKDQIDFEKYDAWNQKIHLIKINKDYIGFKAISSGKDCTLNTDDDIVKEDLKYSYVNKVKKIFQ